MYYLYDMSKGFSLVDKSEDETDIVDTIGERIGCMDTIDYLVMNRTPEEDKTVVAIHSVEDYTNYKYDPNTNYKPKVKLKRIRR